MKRNSVRVALIMAAATLAVLYAVAKAQYAVEGRLGIHGGPEVSDAERALYANAEQISMAQWGNAAVGVLILTITLLPLIPRVRRWNRWILAVPLLLIGIGLIGIGAFMIADAVDTGTGGYPFGIYSTAWGLLVAALALSLISDRRSRDREIERS